MKLLEKGLYGSEFDQKNNLFGLSCGRIKSHGGRLLRDAGWYNSDGEKIGWGDLTEDDAITIRDGLRKRHSDEIFIVLDRHSSYWNLKNRNEMAPGIGYVIEHAEYFITKEEIYITPAFVGDIAEFDYREKVIFRRVNKDYLWKLMTEGLTFPEKVWVAINYVFQL